MLQFLTLKKEKALFGLSSRESLKIAPAGTGNGVWPADTTEAGILSAVGGSEKSVSDAIIAFIGDRAPNPEHDYLSRVKSTLANKGFLTREDKKVLGLKVSVVYHASDEQRTRIAAQGVGDAAALFSEVKSRPEIATRLTKEIGSGLADRTRSDDSGPDLG